jgi:hypothetical protein
MSKGKNNDEKIKFSVEEFIAPLKESEKHDWCKAVARIAWQDNPTTLDIRNLNMNIGKAGKGISLSNEEADKLVDILLDQDYGSLEVIEKALKRKTKRFSITQEADTCFDNKLTIII